MTEQTHAYIIQKRRGIINRKGENYRSNSSVRDLRTKRWVLDGKVGAGWMEQSSARGRGRETVTGAGHASPETGGQRHGAVWRCCKTLGPSPQWDPRTNKPDCSQSQFLPPMEEEG